MIKQIYVIGPVTGIPEDNLPAFKEAKTRLREAGYSATIPHDIVLPHFDHDKAMLYSISCLTQIAGDGERLCDGVAVLPGWEDSADASCEHLVAEQCGIPCKTVEEWLEEAR